MISQRIKLFCNEIVLSLCEINIDLDKEEIHLKFQETDDLSKMIARVIRFQGFLMALERISNEEVKQKISILIGQLSKLAQMIVDQQKAEYLEAMENETEVLIALLGDSQGKA